MVKKSFWVDKSHAWWVKEIAKKRKGTESEVIRFLIETEMRKH